MKQKKKRGNRTDTKNMILKESEKLFAQKGFDNTGIDEIAKKVGIRKSVIYYHFKNKDHILQTMLKKFFDAGMEFKKKNRDKLSADPERNFKRILENMVKFGEGKERLAKILLMESIKSSEKVPLFEFWEKHALISGELYEGKSKNLSHSSMFKAFFMAYLPWVGYLVFTDRWCEHFHLEKEEIRVMFIDTMIESFEKIMKPKT